MDGHSMGREPRAASRECRRVSLRRRPVFAVLLAVWCVAGLFPRAADAGWTPTADDSPWETAADEGAGTFSRRSMTGLPLVAPPATYHALDTLVSADFRGVEPSVAFDYLAERAGVNIVLSEGALAVRQKVTLFFRDMPLKSALKYLSKNMGLSWRVEPSAIWIETVEESSQEEVETRVYFLNQGKGMTAEFSGGDGVHDGLGSGPTIGEVKSIRDVLDDVIPPAVGSSLVFDERSGALIATNTPSNLELIEEILYSIDVTPVQVVIEARFLEVNVIDLNELGLEWSFTSPWKVSKSDGQARTQVASGSGTNFTDSTRQSEGFNFTYQGILTRPEFEVVLHALEETQKAKTLSAPKVTTLNHQEASIEVVDEFIYPTRYEVTLVQFDINGDGDFDDANETEFVNAPKDFVTRNIGIILKVTPSVGKDGTITLVMTPEVSEHDGTFFTYSGGVSIPRFTTRTLSTTVSIQDGETVVLGGLVSETVSKTTTKVPFFGDLPLLGRLFRKEGDNAERSNLLIFVTARLLNPVANSGSVLEDFPALSELPPLPGEEAWTREDGDF